MNLKDKKILVTGGAGFLGKYVVRELQKAGCKDVIIPRSKNYDLTREEDVRNLFSHSPVDAVIHLAAVVGGIGLNQEQPGTLFFKNVVMGTLMMEYARLSGVEKFIALGTVCCYPKYTEVPFKEEDLWKGYPEETNAPYGLAKKMLLVQGQAYRRQFGLNSIFLMPTNLYGPGDNFDPSTSHVIPALIKKVLEAKATVEVWGTGNATRDFLYVEDAARAIVLATEKYDEQEPVNIGTGEEIRIRDLVALIGKLANFQGSAVWNSAKSDGQPRRCLDVSKAKEYFGFEAKTLLEEGLKRTINWYLGNE